MPASGNQATSQVDCPAQTQPLGDLSEPLAACRQEPAFAQFFMNQLTLCSRSRALTTQAASLSRHSTHALETGNVRKQPPPAPHDSFIRPGRRNVRIEPDQQIQVVIQH